MPKHVVAAADDIPPGSRKLVNVKGRPIVVFNVAGEYFGLLNRCPHQGGNLCEGKLTGLLEAAEPGQYRYSRQGEILRCPWHGWEFDVRTGQSYCEPDKIKARKFDVSLTEGRSIIEGPYVAETFPVAVEGHYVVMTM
jgi:nitrite reductase/ring-hydroxylating ferredoxin subunit